jgi:hypothetical protein
VGLIAALGQANAEDRVGRENPVGTVSGTVTVDSVHPQVERFIITKNFPVCGSGTRDKPLIRTNGRALRDAVVYLEDTRLEGNPHGKRFPAATKKITINQIGCRFVPFLSVLAMGGILEVINSDPALHNIHAYEMTKTGLKSFLNVSQPSKGNIVSKSVTLESGDALKITCDAHNFMLAYVFVPTNPYYAVVDEKGAFTITGVPPGEYTIKTWHGFLGTQRGRVKIEADATTTISFTY